MASIPLRDTLFSHLSYSRSPFLGMAVLMVLVLARGHPAVAKRGSERRSRSGGMGAVAGGVSSSGLVAVARRHGWESDEHSASREGERRTQRSMPQGEDLLALVPRTHLVLDVRLARLRRSPVVTPLLARLERELAKMLADRGLQLGPCEADLSPRLDRVVLALPLGSMGSLGGSGGAGRATSIGRSGGDGAGRDSDASRGTRGQKPEIGGATDPAHTTTVYLKGRFDAHALARCHQREVARRIQFPLPHHRGLSRTPGSVRGASQRGSGAMRAARSPVVRRLGVTAVNADTLALQVEGAPVSSPLTRGFAKASPASNAPSPSSEFASVLPQDPDTVLTVHAHGLTLAGQRIPGIEELSELRGVSVTLGLPSEGLELRAALSLATPTAAVAVGKKLSQALTLLSFTLPTTFHLTSALRSAKVQARGAIVHMTINVAPGELPGVLSALTRGGKRVRLGQ